MRSQRWLITFSFFTLAITGCGEDLATRVEKSTVLIKHKDDKGKDQHGTGFFVQGPDNICTVLTANHVAASGKTIKFEQAKDGKTATLVSKINLQLKTYDERTWKAANIQPLLKMDLAIVTFASDSQKCPYKSLEMGQSDKAKRGDEIFIAGFPDRGGNRLLFQFVPGQVTATPDIPLEQGYAISYAATTVGGMSGGPVLNKSGKVIAVHGLADVEIAKIADAGTGDSSEQQKSQVSEAKNRINLGLPTFKWGIPIKSYLGNIPAISLIPSEPTAEEWVGHGMIPLVLGLTQDAFGFFDKATKLKPDYADAWYYRGKALQNLDKYQDALVSFDKALTIEPNDSGSLTERGIVLFSLNRYSEAIQSFDKALTIKKDNPRTLCGKGATLSSLKQYQAAITSFDQGLAIDKSIDWCWSARGAASYNLGKYEKALESFDKALSIDKNDAHYWAMKSWVLNKLGQYNAALESSQKAINLKQDSADAWFGRSWSLANLEDYEGAYKAIENVLRIEPNYGEGKKLRGILLEQLGR